MAERLPISNRFRRLLQRQSLTGFDLYHHAMGYSPDMLALLHRDIRSELCASDENKMALDYRRCAARRRVERYGSVDLRNYLPDDILVKVDRASMHHSLEVRCPLLDHELIELAHQIPTRYKLRWGRGKLLLRTLLRRFLPVELIERPKMGFGVPLARWFRGELKPLLDDMLADRGSVVWQWLDHEVVASRFAAHQTERVNFQAALWRCLFLYCWTLQNRTHAEPAHCQRPLPQTT